MSEETGSSERLAISIGLHENFIVACASGELDHLHAGMFHRQVQEAWQTTQPAALVLDLGKLTFCDSMGIGVLVLLLRQSREQGSPLVLSGVPTHLERILTITGLRSAFLVEPSVDEAIESIKAQIAPQGPPALPVPKVPGPDPA